MSARARCGVQAIRSSALQGYSDQYGPGGVGVGSRRTVDEGGREDRSAKMAADLIRFLCCRKLTPLTSPHPLSPHPPCFVWYTGNTRYLPRTSFPRFMCTHTRTRKYYNLCNIYRGKRYFADRRLRIHRYTLFIRSHRTNGGSRISPSGKIEDNRSFKKNNK